MSVAMMASPATMISIRQRARRSLFPTSGRSSDRSLESISHSDVASHMALTASPVLRGPFFSAATELREGSRFQYSSSGVVGSKDSGRPGCPLSKEVSTSPNPSREARGEPSGAGAVGRRCASGTSEKAGVDPAGRRRVDGDRDNPAVTGNGVADLPGSSRGSRSGRVLDRSLDAEGRNSAGASGATWGSAMGTAHTERCVQEGRNRTRPLRSASIWAGW